ncbi:MBL fold metallo-hydrolase [Nocardiopsis algeriensis]|uniref:MBL fold metallo-hydrolase n=1 Tax=Nocardiopsis algeriensis TaxID=1478215 RepID=UPI003B43AE3F
MPSPLSHAADLARHLAHRRARDRDNAQALTELLHRPLPLAPGLDLQWLGTAGYRLTHQGHTLLIDPYWSRAPLSSLLLRTPALPDPSLIDRYLPDPGTVVGVLVGHGHFDHALDAPALARRFGCPVHGSTSVARLMALHGLAHRAVTVQPHHPYELGPFTVTFVPSRHSRIPLGTKVPWPGDTDCTRLSQLAPQRYGCGQTWGIHIDIDGYTLYHQGSADLVDDQIRHRDVDLFLAGIAGRSVTPRYWQRILPLLRPKALIPCHYDDFLRPLHAPLRFTVDVRLSDLQDEIAAVDPDIALAALPAPKGTP